MIKNINKNYKNTQQNYKNVRIFFLNMNKTYNSISMILK